MKLMKVNVLIAAIGLLLPFQLQAQQGGKINFGNLSIIPGVELQSVYDDNIYKGNGDAQTKQEERKSDWINHVKPSLALNYSMQERGSAVIGYRGDYAFYSSETNNNWKNNQGYVDVNYLAPGGLILGINNIYARSEDPLGNAEQYNQGRVTKRWTNDLKTKLGYALASNLRGIVYYNNSKQKYDDIVDYSQNYTENEYGMGIETRFLPKTWGFLRYHYGQRKYDTLGPDQEEAYNSNYKWHRISTGLSWDPDAKLSGELNVGYQMLKYDNEDAKVNGTLLRRDDKNTWTAATSVNYQATATTSLSLNITRAVRNSASDNNEQFVDTGIGFNLNQKLLAKLALLAGVGYAINDYNTATGVPSGESRSDKNYTANLGLNYDIQEWLGVGVAYNFSRKESNAPENEYTDNQLMASLKIAY